MQRTRFCGPFACLVMLAGLVGCDSSDVVSPITVNSLEDTATPPLGTMTLRAALAIARPGQPIHFAPHLDGGTIELSLVDAPHTPLPGEVMGIRIDPSGPISYLVGYFDRDYGASALFAYKDVVLDASMLPSGITFRWMGGVANPARVLAVRGDLALRNVTITGGINVAEDIANGDPAAQPWTLARGGGLAVWGLADLADCTIHDNRVEGDFDSSRDRGAFGGGVWANLVRISNCTLSGNSVLGGGAAGGGVYVVGGAISSRDGSVIDRSSITGNRISGLFTYGGGVYSDGGGIGNQKSLSITNSTIARNLVEPAPGLPGFLLRMGYWRGGAVYMSNGELLLKSVTLVENETHGVARTDDLGKPNLAGGVAATIGNAHAVEDLLIGHSIVAGNSVHEIGGAVYPQDIFTGSLFYFRSLGFNRLGVVDFSQMLAPLGVPTWASLSRRHYPQPGDESEVLIDDVVDLSGGVTCSPTVLSRGVDDGQCAVLHYRPRGSSIDVVPTAPYRLEELLGEYRVAPGGIDDFLSILLGRIEAAYGLPGFANAFVVDFDAFLQSVDTDPATAGLQPYLDPAGAPILDLADVGWFGPAQTWPAELANHPYIHFWHRLDAALGAEQIPALAPQGLGDEAWGTLFTSGPLIENPAITMSIFRDTRTTVSLRAVDQLGLPRPAGPAGDIGAIELP